VGVATQDPQLRKKFAGKAEHVERFMHFVAEEARGIMAQLGFRTFDEMIGRVDMLSFRKAETHWKAAGLDLSPLFVKPDTRDGRATRCVRSQPNRLAGALDWEILEKARPAIEGGQKVKLEMPIRNVHRSVGAILSNRIVKACGPKGLPDSSIELTFRGSAGQSFGAWLAPGVTLRLIGEANDYVGKGLSGGRIAVQTPPGAAYAAHENIIVGNTVLYGATAGEMYINGLAGERFGVRNSGAAAVVEGVGDHGCEYMTKGVVVVLGPTGYNFAAGMSGGVAYVLDEHQLFDTLCNLDMVDIETVWHEKDRKILSDLITQHYRWTGSWQARRILDDWAGVVGRFVKVMPIDYRRVLERIKEHELPQAEFTPATEEVFRRA
jgi:glutamate synthase domain-containing protein 3